MVKNVRSSTDRLKTAVMSNPHDDEIIFDSTPLTPFLKWAGGKRWFVKNHSDLLPEKFNTYYEPFLGSGAVFFSLKPKKAILADVNPNLIETYKAIKKDWKKVRTALLRHNRNHSPAYYYAERDRIRYSPYERAAQFIYLNRTCWNGLYRVNLSGKFNVPIGTKDTVILDTDNFAALAKCLKNTTLLKSDFESIINRAQKGDFVFIDPPYTINHNLNGFIKYNEKIFTWEDQVRLKNCVLKAHQRGALVIVTNANHPSIRELYEGFGSLKTLDRHSVLAGDASYRKASSELVIVSTK